MRIVIIGAGNAGRHLARTLGSMAHDVVVIDKNKAPLTELESQIDVLTIQGQGASPAILEQAEIGRADLVVAVTSRDEVNILACAYAKACGVEHKVARVAQKTFDPATCRLDVRALGVDLMVSHKEECAREIANMLRLAGTQEVVDLLDGKAVAVGIKVGTTSPLLRTNLVGFPDADLISRIRFIAAVRGEELIIPRGDTQFMLGDDVYVVMLPDQVRAFLDWACPDHPRFEKVIIGGGGDLGLSLARRLEDLPMQVTLFELNRERAEVCARELDKTLVMCGNLLHRETLCEAGLIDNTAYIAVTGDDENNIISCLVAEKEGASFTLAQVTKPEYVPIINSLSLLDRAVSPHVSMTNAILHFVRGHHVAHAALLHNLPGELLELDLPEGSKLANKPIHSVNLPKGAIIATLLRGEEAIPATGDTVLQAGDRVVIFSLPQAVEKVQSRLQK